MISIDQEMYIDGSHSIINLFKRLFHGKGLEHTIQGIKAHYTTFKLSISL